MAWAPAASWSHQHWGSAEHWVCKQPSTSSFPGAALGYPLSHGGQCCLFIRDCLSSVNLPCPSLAHWQQPKARGAAKCCPRPTSLYLKRGTCSFEWCHLDFARPGVATASSSSLPAHSPQPFRAQGMCDCCGVVPGQAAVAASTLCSPAPASLPCVLTMCLQVSIMDLRCPPWLDQGHLLQGFFMAQHLFIGISWTA